MLRVYVTTGLLLLSLISPVTMDDYDEDSEPEYDTKADYMEREDRDCHTDHCPHAQCRDGSYAGTPVNQCCPSPNCCPGNPHFCRPNFQRHFYKDGHRNGAERNTAVSCSLLTSILSFWRYYAL